MDYEKAYKESFERAKKLKAGFEGYNANVAIVEQIFPELTESEDERIRKQLINEVKEQINNIPAPDCCSSDDLKRLTILESWIAYLEKQKEHKPILEVFGFKVGDAVRLKDGDGRKHIIKSFEEVKGIHGPNFYLVEFEDNSARDGIIYPGEGYPNGYYTHMEKFEKEQKSIPPEDEKDFLEKEVKAFLCSYDKEFDDDAPAYDIAEHFYRLGKKAQEEQKPAENGTRTKIINRATNEKQVVLLSESNGSAEIDWDTRSLEDTKKLLEHGIAFINKQLGTKPAEWGNNLQ